MKNDNISRATPLHNAWDGPLRHSQNPSHSSLKSFSNQASSAATPALLTRHGVKFVAFYSGQYRKTQETGFVDTLKHRTIQEISPVATQKTECKIQETSQSDTRPKTSQSDVRSKTSQPNASQLDARPETSQLDAKPNALKNRSYAEILQNSTPKIQGASAIQGASPAQDASAIQGASPAQGDLNFIRLKKEAQTLAEKLNKIHDSCKTKPQSKLDKATIDKFFKRIYDLPENINNKDRLSHYLKIFEDYENSGCCSKELEKYVIKKIMITTNYCKDGETGYKFASVARMLISIGSNSLEVERFWFAFYSKKSPEKAKNIQDSFTSMITANLKNEFTAIETLNKQGQLKAADLNIAIQLLIDKKLGIGKYSVECKYDRVNPLDEKELLEMTEYRKNIAADQEQLKTILKKIPHHRFAMSKKQSNALAYLNSTSLQAKTEKSIILYDMHRSAEHDVLEKVFRDIEHFIEAYPNEQKLLLQIMDSLSPNMKKLKDQIRIIFKKIKELQKLEGNNNKEINLCLSKLYYISDLPNNRAESYRIIEELHKNKLITDQEKEYHITRGCTSLLTHEEQVKKLLFCIERLEIINETARIATGKNARHIVLDKSKLVEDKIFLFSKQLKFGTINKEHQDERVPTAQQGLDYCTVLSNEEPERIKLEPEDLQLIIDYIKEQLKSDKKVSVNKARCCNISANSFIETNIAEILIEYSEHLYGFPDPIETGLVILLILRQRKNSDQFKSSNRKALRKPCSDFYLEQRIALAMYNMGYEAQAIQLLEAFNKDFPANLVKRTIGHYSDSYARKLDHEEEDELATTYHEKALNAFMEYLNENPHDDSVKREIAHIEQRQGHKNKTHPTYDRAENETSDNHRLVYSPKDGKIRKFIDDEFHQDAAMARGRYNKK